MAGYLGNTQKISGSYTVDEFTSSGGTTYTLSKTPGAKNNIQVSAGGLTQYPSAYSVSGTTLTLSGVPSGQKVVVRHMGDTIPYPLLADDAVTSAKIANDAVTGAKLNPALVAGDVIYADGTDTINRLAKGTAAQALVMNAGATAPEWADAAGGTTGSYFLASLTSNQSVANGIVTKATLATENYDTEGEYDPTTNYRYTPTAGTYYLYANIHWIDFAANTRSQIHIKKNGSDIAFKRAHSAYSEELSQSNSVITAANGTDYYELFVYQNTGSALLLIGDGTSMRTSFGGFRLV